MAVKSEEIQLRIVASGNAAKKELADLAQTQEDLKRKIDGLDKKSKDYAATKRKLTAELQQTNERMRKLRSEMDLNSMSMRDLRNRANDLKRVMDNMKPNTPEWNRLNGQLQQTNDRMRELRGSTQQLRGGWENMMGSVKGGMVAGGIGAAVGLFAIGFNKLKDAVVETTIQFQKMEAVLTLALGSKSAAKKSMEDLKQFAATTPFQIDALTESYVKLVNRGFQPTMDEMRKMGDLASSTGKEMDQLVEAILDAQTGEFERLKEFGIRASKSGDQVSFAFKGIETQVELTEDAIRNAILSFGEMEGVQGSMDAISKTLGGRLSNLQDNFTQMAYELGVLFTNMFDMNAAADTLGEGVSSLTKGIQRFAEGVLQARQWMRDWYDDSVVLRGAVQLLSAGVKTNILFLVQFLDMAIVKPIQGIIAGIKATRLVMEGEFKQAGAVLKYHFNAVVDDWKQFGSEYKGIWSDAIDEVRNPQPWKELDTNSAKALNNLKENAKAAVAQAKADIEALKKIVAEGDGNGLPERGGNTTSSFDQEAMQKQIEDKAYLTQQLWELARTSEELELEAANAYYNELADLAKKYGGDSVLIEKKRQEDIANIKKKFAQNNVKAEEITLQQGLNNLSGALDQVEGLLGENAAAMQSFGLFKLAIDTATSISSAIAGATQAAAATGPGAPFTIAAYIASMVATVVGAFVKAKKLITGADAPKFAKGGVLSGPRHAMGGMAVVDQYGNKQAEVEGGEAILPVETTNANMPFIQYMLANPGKTVMPTPSVNIDTSSLNTSVSGAPRFANGGTMPTAPNYVTTSSAADNSAVVATLEKLTAAVLMDKDRRAVVSIQQFTDKQEDLDTIKKFSDIRST